MHKIRAMLKMTANLKTQSVSMRRKLMAYWITMILTAIGLFLFILSLTGVLSDKEHQLKENISLQLMNADKEISQHLDHLTAQCMTFSEQISREIETMLIVNGKKIADLNDSPDLLKELQSNLYDKLYTTLRVSECSGAFFVLDATTNTKIDAAKHSRSGMYIRYANMSTRNAAIQDVVYFRGIPDVARAEQLELHNRWNLEFDSSLLPGYENLINKKAKEIPKTGYWSEKIHLTDTWEDVILMSVPVYDNTGTVVGLCGVEISELYFYLSYPAMESPFGIVTTVLAPMSDGVIELDKGVTASADDTYLDGFDRLEIKENSGCYLYMTKEEKYLGEHSVISADTIYGDKMGIAVLVKKDSYDDVVFKERVYRIVIFLIFFLVMFVLSMIFTDRFLKPISTSLQAIQNEEIPEQHRSGISEIDMLLEFVKMKNEARNMGEGALPPNIEELFESFIERVEELTVSERRIFNYYVEGADAVEITEKAFISMSTVRKHSGNIYKKLNISSRDELMLYVDLFRRCGRMDWLDMKHE